MNETVAQYTARLTGYTEGKDPLAIQRETARTLARLTEGQSEEALTRRPAPGKWSVREILAHFAEGEIVIAWRYRQMIEQSGVALAAYDQNAWARLGDYSAEPPQESLELFRALRKKNLQMLERLTPEEWQHFGVHSERGKMTLKELVRQVAGHDLNHIAQVREILAQREINH